MSRKQIDSSTTGNSGKKTVSTFRDSFPSTTLARELEKVVERALPMQGHLRVVSIELEETTKGTPIHGKKLIKNLDPATVGWVIRLGPAVDADGGSSNPPAPEDDRRKFIRLMAYLERSSQLPFVGLKYVRDRMLQDPTFECSATVEQRHAFMRAMTAQRIVETYAVDNAKNPEHPTTAIRLNRTHPAVKAMVENDLDLRPAASSPRRLVKVSGPPLADDIIRGRR